MGDCLTAEEVNDVLRRGQNQDSIDALFRLVDWHMREDKVDELGDILLGVEASFLNTFSATAVLASVFRFRHKLPWYRKLFESVKSHLDVIAPERAQRLTEGMAP